MSQKPVFPVVQSMNQPVSQSISQSISQSVSPMAFAPAVPVVVSVPKSRLIDRINTLQWLYLGILALVLLLLWLASAMLSASGAHRQALKIVGRDAAPSVVAAQNIKAALADLDASAANELLAEAGQGQAARQNYEQRRKEIAKALIQAAKNITYGDSEQKPIEDIQIGLGEYEVQIQQARSLHLKNDPQMLVAYRQAAQIMDQTLLRAADELSNVNEGELNRVFDSLVQQNAAGRLGTGFLGLLLLALLLTVQVFIARRCHRRINVGLVASVLLASVGLTTLWLALGRSDAALNTAKRDAFTSVRVLLDARANAFSANGDESRYLLDQANAPYHQMAFEQKTQAILSLPDGVLIENALGMTRGKREVPGFNGFLAKELTNITYAGELDAAEKSAQTFVNYLAIDRNIRELNQNKRRAEAIALCVGIEHGQSNWAFAQFNEALDKTLAINSSGFSTLIDSGLASLDNNEGMTMLLLLAVLGVTVAGLWPRIAEYS
jgi:hypothetical protein